MTDKFRSLKNAFARFATGVTVVSCAPRGKEPLAITVNSFASVSLDPMLISWCLDKQTSVFEDFMAAPNYAVSILAADQQAHSNRFATPGNHHFAKGEGEVFITGAPLISGRLAGFDCVVKDRFEAGDHIIIVGEIQHFDSCNGAPLIYAGRQYLTGAGIAD